MAIRKRIGMGKRSFFNLFYDYSATKPTEKLKPCYRMFQYVNGF